MVDLLMLPRFPRENLPEIGEGVKYINPKERTGTVSGRRVILKQVEPPVPSEVIASSIEAISEGLRKLRAGRLNDRALVLLIQHACPTSGIRKPVSAREVRAVLDGIESLEREYLKKAAPREGKE